MGAVFAKTPIRPTVVALEVGKIYFDAPCKYCRDGRRATTNIRPVVLSWTGSNAVRIRISLRTVIIG
jgi:hypothetical protein